MSRLLKSLALITGTMILMAVSCEKEEESVDINRPTVIEGHLFKSCEQTEVYANLDLFFYEKQGFNLSGDKIKYLGTTRTNDAGFYRFDVGSCTYGKDIEVKDGNDELLFVAACGGDIGYGYVDRCSGIPTSENIIKLITNSTLTNQDTLHIGFAAVSNTILAVGPFKNGQLLYSGKIAKPTFPNGMISVPIGSKVNSSAYWAIGNDNFNCVRYFDACRNDTNYLRGRVVHRLCQMGDTIYLNLDLARNWASL